MSLISVLHIDNSAQFLNATSISFPAFTVIFPVTKIYGSEYLQRLDLTVCV